MTVQGEASAPAVDRDAAAQYFTELFQQYMPRVRKFIWSRLDVREECLADDLTQETFAELWAKVVLAGKPINKPFGLLCTIARGQLWDHFDRMSSHERALDFADPVNTPILATGHAYAAGRPDTALMVAELDTVMDEMRALSEQWQGLHQESYRLRQQGSPDRLSETDQAEEAALSDFRAACQRVGELRAEIQAVAGPAWRSSVPGPERRSMALRAVGYRTDFTIGQCPAGHRMTYQNTSFRKDEQRAWRECRTCRPSVKPSYTGQPGQPSEGVERARRMLADPAYLHLSVKAVAKEAGTNASRLFHRLPVSELRQAAKQKAADLEATAR